MKTINLFLHLHSVPVKRTMPLSFPLFYRVYIYKLKMYKKRLLVAKERKSCNTISLILEMAVFKTINDF